MAGRTRPSTTCAAGLGSASYRRHIPSPTAPVCVAPYGRAAAAVYVFRPLPAALRLAPPSSSVAPVLPTVGRALLLVAGGGVCGCFSPAWPSACPAVVYLSRALSQRVPREGAAPYGRVAPITLHYTVPRFLLLRAYVYHKLCPVGQFFMGGVPPYTPCFDVYGGFALLLRWLAPQKNGSRAAPVLIVLSLSRLRRDDSRVLRCSWLDSIL